MTAISIPPRPAFLYFSIAAVRSAGVTMLPGHHHLVQGLVSFVISGQDNSWEEMACVNRRKRIKNFRFIFYYACGINGYSNCKFTELKKEFLLI
jgi:hypothetical protein